MKLAAMTAIQESVEALLTRKAEEMGRVLTSREEEYLRLQVERNELVLQFPHTESRGEDVLQTLQRIKNRLKKLAKGRPLDDVLKLPLRSEPPKSAAERKSDQRGKMSLEARDKEREDNRKRIASPEELERGRKRKKTPEQLEKTKVRMQAPEQLEKAKVRMQAPEQLEKAKVRMQAPEQLEKAKVRMQAPEQLEEARERMSLPINKEKDAARKREKRRLERIEREKEDEWPRAPQLCCSIAAGGGGGDLQVKYPDGNLKSGNTWTFQDPVPDSWWSEESIHQPSVQGPTFSLDQPLRIRAEFNCYPPPTIVWMKDGKVMARDTITYVLKEGINASSDCQKERVAPESELRFRVESFYRHKLPETSRYEKIPDAWSGKHQRVKRIPIPAELVQQGWSDFIIQDPKLCDEGVYAVRVFNDFGVVEDFIQV